MAREMNSSRAARIAAAMGLQPGIVFVTARQGETSVCGFRRRGLDEVDETFGATQLEQGLATQRAIRLAITHQVPMVLHFEPWGARK